VVEAMPIKDVRIGWGRQRWVTMSSIPQPKHYYGSIDKIGTASIYSSPPKNQVPSSILAKWSDAPIELYPMSLDHHKNTDWDNNK